MTYDLGDFVQDITEMLWGQTTLEMGFLKFFLTFVGIFVIIKAYLWLIGEDDE